MWSARVVDLPIESQIVHTSSVVLCKLWVRHSRVLGAPDINKLDLSLDQLVVELECGGALGVEDRVRVKRAVDAVISES